MVEVRFITRRSSCFVIDGNMWTALMFRDEGLSPLRSIRTGARWMR